MKLHEEQAQIKKKEQEALKKAQEKKQNRSRPVMHEDLITQAIKENMELRKKKQKL